MDEHKIGLSPAVIDEREGTEASGRRVAEAIEEKEAVFTISQNSGSLDFCFV